MRLSVVAVAWLVLVSCSDPIAPADDLDVTASAAPSVLRAGEIAEVIVTVTNRGDRVHSVRYDCWIPFAVNAEDGTAVGPPDPAICPAIWIPPTKLAPGEELVIPAQWWVGNVPPGTYLLRGRVRAISQYDPVTGPPVAVLVTN